LLSIAVNIFFLPVSIFVAHHTVPAYRSVSIAANLLGVALAAGVVMLASKPRLDPRLVLDLALVYEVAYGLLISLTDPRIPLTKANALGGFSGVAVWALLFPILIPNTRGKIVLATLVTVAMDPLGKMIYVLLGAPPPEAFAFTSTAVAAVLGIVISGLIFRISVQASRARELGSYRRVEPLGSGGGAPSRT